MKHTMTSPVFHRVLAALGLGSAFLIMASVFSPDRMMAQSTPPSSMNHRLEQSPSSTDPHEGLRSLGSIESAAHVIQIFATDAGPRYTISSVAGTELGVLMSPEQVRRFFPELDLPDTDFSATESATEEVSEAIMLMDQLPIAGIW